MQSNGACGYAKLLHLPVMEPLLAGRSCSEKSDLEQSGAMRLRDSSAVEDAWLPEEGVLVVETWGERLREQQRALLTRACHLSRISCQERRVCARDARSGDIESSWNAGVAVIVCEER